MTSPGTVSRVSRFLRSPFPDGARACDAQARGAFFEGLVAFSQAAAGTTARKALPQDALDRMNGLAQGNRGVAVERVRRPIARHPRGAMRASWLVRLSRRAGRRCVADLDARRADSPPWRSCGASTRAGTRARRRRFGAVVRPAV